MGATTTSNAAAAQPTRARPQILSLFPTILALLLLLLGRAHPAATSAAPDPAAPSTMCPQFCYCIDDFATCSGFTFLDLTMLPPTVRTLVLSRGEVEEITPAFLATAPNLEILELSSVHVSIVRSSAFRGLSQLDLFTITGSSFDIVEPDSFSGINNVNKFQISDSSFGRIGKHAFGNISNVNDFEMWANAFDYFAEEAFRGLNNVETFQMYGNNITSFGKDVFLDAQDLGAVRFYQNKIGEAAPGSFDTMAELSGRLIFEGNTFRCDCRLAWMLEKPILDEFMDENSCVFSGGRRTSLTDSTFKLSETSRPVLCQEEYIKEAEREAMENSEYQRNTADTYEEYSHRITPFGKKEAMQNSESQRNADTYEEYSHRIPPFVDERYGEIDHVSADGDDEESDNVAPSFLGGEFDIFDDFDFDSEFLHPQDTDSASSAEERDETTETIDPTVGSEEEPHTTVVATKAEEEKSSEFWYTAGEGDHKEETSEQTEETKEVTSWESTEEHTSYTPEANSARGEWSTHEGNAGDDITYTADVPNVDNTGTWSTHEGNTGEDVSYTADATKVDNTGTWFTQEENTGEDVEYTEEPTNVDNTGSTETGNNEEEEGSYYSSETRQEDTSGYTTNGNAGESRPTVYTQESTLGSSWFTSSTNNEAEDNYYTPEETTDEESRVSQERRHDADTSYPAGASQSESIWSTRQSEQDGTGRPTTQFGSTDVEETHTETDSQVANTEVQPTPSETETIMPIMETFDMGFDTIGTSDSSEWLVDETSQWHEKPTEDQDMYSDMATTLSTTSSSAATATEHSGSKLLATATAINRVLTKKEQPRWMSEIEVEQRAEMRAGVASREQQQQRSAFEDDRRARVPSGRAERFNSQSEEKNSSSSPVQSSLLFFACLVVMCIVGRQ